MKEIVVLLWLNGSKCEVSCVCVSVSDVSECMGVCVSVYVSSCGCWPLRGRSVQSSTQIVCL